MGDPQVIAEVLGFKLSNMEIQEYKEPAPIMTVIALLLQHGLISLDDIYPWVSYSSLSVQVFNSA